MLGVPTSLTGSPIRCLNAKSSRQNVARAITAAVEEGREVISISLCIPWLSWFGGRPMGWALDHAYDNGVIIVGAGGQGVDGVTYFGKSRRTIGVGGVSPGGGAWHACMGDMLEHIDV